MRSRHRPALLLTALLAAGCGGPKEEPAPTPVEPAPTPVPGGLPPGILAVKGLGEDLPPADLAPLKAMLAGRSVVALGESVHTSGGYSQAKLRLFRYLVEEMGFRVFAMENPWTAAEATARYVATCQGTAHDAAHALFGVWANTAVESLLAWMCGYNQRHPEDPILFTGFDMQQPWDDGPALRAFLDKATPADAPRLSGGLKTCDGADAGSEEKYYGGPGLNRSFPQEELDACLKGLDDIEAHLAANEAAVVAATSTEALAWGRIALVGLRSWQKERFYLSSDALASYQARDDGMAYIFSAMRALRFPKEKVAIWAHNEHIMTRRQDVRSAPPVGWKAMGSLLRERIGDDYQAVGLIGYDVEINWPGVGCGPLRHPSELSVEGRLHALGEPYLLVDLAFPGAAEPFLEPKLSYGLGTVTGARMVPAEQFRALLYLDHSPRMESTDWPTCTPAK
jgi:erythromycin esterase